MTNYFYYCHKNPSNHKHFYLGWITGVNSKTDKAIKLITTNSGNSNKYGDSEAEIYLKSKGVLDSLVIPLFLFKNHRTRKTVVIVRRRNPFFLFLIKPFMKDLRIIVDLEGDKESELKYQRENRKQKNSLLNQIMEKLYVKFMLPFSLKKSNHIFAISENMKKHLVKRYKLKSSDISVFPPGVDTSEIYFNEELRKNLREKYKLKNKFVWLYMGNTLKWQNLEQLVEIFSKSYTENKNQSIIMLLRSPEDQKRFRIKLLENGVLEKDIIIQEASRVEVNKFLNFSDLGVLLREKHLLNILASPGKCGEYASTGLTILTTNYIGDYPHDLDKAKNGIMIDSPFEIENAIKKVEDFNKSKLWNNIDRRQNIANYFATKYSTQANIKRYIKILDEVSGDNIE